MAGDGCLSERAAELAWQAVTAASEVVLLHRAREVAELDESVAAGLDQMEVDPAERLADAAVLCLLALSLDPEEADGALERASVRYGLPGLKVSGAW